VQDVIERATESFQESLSNAVLLMLTNDEETSSVIQNGHNSDVEILNQPEEKTTRVQTRRSTATNSATTNPRSTRSDQNDQHPEVSLQPRKRGRPSRLETLAALRSVVGMVKSSTSKGKFPSIE